MSGHEETERIQYKEKVKKQENAIQDLLEIASEHTRLFSPSMKKALNERKQECERLYRKLDKNEFEIAIVGLEKAGKSTFANALMGNKILPDADERCTYTSTCIRYGHDKAVVRFFTESEFNQKLQDNLRAMGFENTEQYSLSTLSKFEYEGMFQHLKPGEQMAFGNNIHKDILNIFENKEALLHTYLGKEEIRFEGEELRGEELKQYIVSKDVAIAVKEVSIESSKLENMQNAIIYDVPGFDSPTRIHAEQTEDRMKKADVIILIASAEKPSFTAPSLDMFNKVVDEDNVELSDKLFVFGNRADAANTLEKNIQTLRNETRNCGLLHEVHLNERLFVGSAKAYLQKIGQEEGDFCIKKLNEKTASGILEHGDGIEYTYEKLLEYNQTDRFRVLKRKVNENDQNIQKIFKELREEYKDSEYSFSDMKELLQEGSRLCDGARTILRRGLEGLREEVRNKYKAPLLSNKMRDRINQLFDNENYLITEEDLADAKRKIKGTTSSIDVEKVEIDIREKKCEVIYNEFSENILKIAAADHREYYDKIVGLFYEALQVKKESVNSDDISRKIRELVEKHKRCVEEKDNYQALIERFVRDLVEVLIMRPYGQEARLNRFIDDKSIFSGLIMFYDPGENERYKRTFMATAPKDQPMLYAMLFHEYKDSITACKSVFEYISSMASDVCDSAVVIQLICSIVKKNPLMAVDAVKKAVQKSDISKYKDAEGILPNITGKLRNALRNMPFAKTPFAGTNEKEHEISEYDFTDDRKFSEQYKRYFGNQKMREYQDIMQQYEADLEILQDFLIHASIPAISIEKPFIAKEVKSIDELLDYVDSTDFSDFVANNFHLLRKEACDEFSRKQNDRLINQDVVRKIEKVLRTMDVA